MIDALLSQDPILYLCVLAWLLLMIWATAVGLFDWAAVLTEEVAALPHPDDDTDEEVAA